MITSPKQLNNWLLFCTGLLLGTMFCMKMLEPHFISNGHLFTIIGIEITYDQSYFSTLLAGLDAGVEKLLRFHLYADFVFMAGVYPAIAILCLKARLKQNAPFIRKLLLILAIAQIIAWLCDITENLYILNQLNHPEARTGFSGYHLVVWVKWLLAFTGLLTALIFLLKRKKSL